MIPSENRFPLFRIWRNKSFLEQPMGEILVGAAGTASVPAHGAANAAEEPGRDQFLLVDALTPVDKRRDVKRVDSAIKLAEKTGLAILWTRNDPRLMRYLVEHVLRTRGDADLAGDSALMADKLDHDVSALASARCSVGRSVCQVTQPNLIQSACAQPMRQRRILLRKVEAPVEAARLAPSQRADDDPAGVCDHRRGFTGAQNCSGRPGTGVKMMARRAPGAVKTRQRRGKL